MPQFSYQDRLVLQDEMTLWACVELLKDHGDHAWGQRIEELREQIQKLAAEIRDYNDQFETEE